MLTTVYGTMLAAFLMTVCSAASGTSLDNVTGVLVLLVSTVLTYNMVAGAVWFSYVYTALPDRNGWWH